MGSGQDELLNAEAVADAYIWTDDRFLNSYNLYGELPIITVAEVLSILRRKNNLNEQEYYQKLLLLRAANCRFVPFDEEEIIYHLKKASIKDIQILETPELAILRRYAASCILTKDIIQLPMSATGLPLPHCPQGEIETVLNLLFSVRRTIHILWSDDKLKQNEIVAYADWLLQNFWFNIAALLTIHDKRPGPEQQKELLGNDFVSLLVQGISLANNRIWKRNDVKPPRDRYVQWLTSRFPQDLESIKLFSRQLRRVFLQDIWIKTGSQHERKANQLILSEFISELPAPLKDWVRLPRSALRRIGIRQYAAVETPDWKFSAESFWNAAERAIRKGISRISSVEVNRQFDIKPAIKGETIELHFNPKDSDNSFVLSDPAFTVVDHTVSERLENLKKYKIWFDMPNPDLEKKATELARNENTPERMIQLNFLRKKSPAYSYEILRRKLNDREQITTNDFRPPPLRRLVTHLRLPHGAEEMTFSQIISQAASTLIQDEGFFETFRRLSTLPSCLPISLVDQYKLLTQEQKNVWHEKLKGLLHSPISQIQYLWLILQSGDDKETIGKAESIIALLFSDGGELAFEAFRILLQWTFEQIHEQGITSCPTAYLLAASWTHAVRLHNLLGACSSQKTIADYFRAICKINPHDAFESTPHLVGDVVHPRMLRRVTLLAHGIMTAASNNEAALEIKDIKKEMEKLCFHQTTNGLVPKADLLVNPTTYYDHLDSFFSKAREQIFSPLFGDIAKICSASEIEQQADTTLSVLIENQKDLNQWILLHAFQGPKGFPGSLKEKISKLLLSVRSVNLRDFENNTLRLILLWITNEARLLDNEKVIGHVKGELSALANYFASNVSNHNQDEGRVHTLIEAAYSLANVDRGPVSGVRNFIETVSAVKQAWPSAANYMLPLFNRLVFSLPEATAVELWPFVLAIRRTAK